MCHFRQRIEPGHEPAIDPVFPAPDPVPFNHQPVAGAERIAFPGRDEIQRPALRPKRAQALAPQGAANIVGQHRAGADRIDARFRQLAFSKRHRIASREHIVPPDHAQVVLDPQEPALVYRQAGSGKPVGGRRLRRPQDFIGLDRWRLVAHQAAGFDPAHRLAGEYRDPLFGKNSFEARAERRREARQDLGGISHERKRKSRRIVARGCNIAHQPMPDRQQQFDAAGPGTDQRDAGMTFACEHARLERLEAAQEAVDRLHRNGVLVGTGHAGRVRRRADVEREQVIRHGGRWRQITRRPARSRSTASSW